MYIFAYGSLIWNPNFDFLEKYPAKLFNYKRDFCLKEHYHRGDKENHGYVLGIYPQKGFVTTGMVYKIDISNWVKIRNYLIKRENAGGNYYKEKFVDVYDLKNNKYRAYTFVSNEESKSFDNSPCLLTKAKIINSAKGISGPNIDYLNNSIKSLLEYDLIEEEDVLKKIKDYIYKN